MSNENQEQNKEPYEDMYEGYVEKEGEYKEPHNQQEKSTLADFFSFRKLVTPTLVKVLYVLGAIGIVIIAGIMISDARYPEDVFFPYSIIAIVMQIAWRITCEGAILLFKIYNTLTESKEHLRKIAGKKITISFQPIKQREMFKR